MDIAALSSIAANGTTAADIVVGIMTSTEHLAATQVDILMASLGVGNNITTFA